MRRVPLGILLVLAAVLTFSSSSSIVKWADTPGSVVAFWRMIGAIVLWWVVVGGRRVVTGRRPPSAATWRAVLPAGLFFGFNIALMFTAITMTSIAHAEFITALSPLFLVPAGAILFGEQPNPRALAWGALSIVGLAIVLFLGGNQGGATVGRRPRPRRGRDVGLLPAHLAAGTSHRRAGRLHDHDDVRGLLSTAPIALILAGDEIWPLSAKGWAAVALLSVLTGMLAHGLLAASQREVDVATIGILQVAQPALAVVWSYILLGEEIRPAQVPGMVLVIVGLAAFSLVSYRRPANRPDRVEAEQHGELTGPVG